MMLNALHTVDGGESPQPPPMCSIHLDDTTTAILRQNSLHTPAWRGDRVIEPIRMELIWRPWWTEANGQM